MAAGQSCWQRLKSVNSFVRPATFVKHNNNAHHVSTGKNGPIAKDVDVAAAKQGTLKKDDSIQVATTQGRGIGRLAGLLNRDIGGSSPPLGALG